MLHSSFFLKKTLEKTRGLSTPDETKIGVFTGGRKRGPRNREAWLATQLLANKTVTH